MVVRNSNDPNCAMELWLAGAKDVVLSWCLNNETLLERLKAAFPDFDFEELDSMIALELFGEAGANHAGNLPRPSGLSSGFAPTDLSGLRIWLDAQDLSTLTFNGGNISAWADKSGQGNNFSQGTAGFQPEYQATGINSKPGLYFNLGASFRFMTVTDNATLDYTNFSCFCVFSRIDDLGTTETLCGKYSASAPANQKEFRMIITGTDVGNVIGSTDGSTDSAAISVAGALSLSTGYILDSYFDATNLGIAKNNGAFTTTALASMFAGTSPFFIGCRDSGAEKFGGDIGELLFYNRVLSAGERQSVNAYLAAKWNISI